MKDIQTIERQIDEWVTDKLGSDFTFRKYQKEAIISIIANIVDGAEETQLVEALTGSGKSLINIISAGVLSDYYGKTSYILCSDLYLLGQYEDFLRRHKRMGFGFIKGSKGNYTCAQNGEDLTTAECKLAGMTWGKMMSGSQSDKFPCCNSCEYIKERRRAMGANVTVMTYQLFLNISSRFPKNGEEEDDEENSGSPYMWHKRDIVFGDECHNIPSIVQNQYTVELNAGFCDKLLDLYNYGEKRKNSEFSISMMESKDNQIDFDILNTTRYALMESVDEIIKSEWENRDEESCERHYQNVLNVLDLVYRFSDILDDINEYIAKRKDESFPLSKEERTAYRRMTWLGNYACTLEELLNAVDSVGKENLLCQVIRNENGDIERVTFHCLKEDYMCATRFLNKAQYKVLVSATVGGKDAYCENMGVRMTETESASMDVIPSTFDFSKSPIYIFKNFRMSYKEKFKTFPKIKEGIYKTIKQFPNQKGLLQTGSYANAMEIYRDAPWEVKKRMLVYDDSKVKDNVLALHKTSNDTVLVGPTLNEGIDLPDEGCRFIIIAKVPYPSLGDKLVVEKCRLFPMWYKSTTSNAIIQGIGRGIRNSSDYCTTMIFDACFLDLYRTTSDQYPKEMKERFKIV